jgi:hypothetical protein
VGQGDYFIGDEEQKRDYGTNGNNGTDGKKTER